MRWSARFGFALVLALAASSANAATWEHTFDVTGRPNVSLIANDGHVTINTWDRPQVMVHIRTTGFRVPDDLPVEFSQDESNVRVEYRSHFAFGISFSLRNILVEITLPAKSDVDIHTGDGGIVVPALEGNLKLWTGDGSIHAMGCRGDMDFHSGDGGIEAFDLDGSLHARTGDGHMRVSGRFDRLRLESGDGGIRAEVARGSALAEDWLMHTGDGRLTVRLPQELKANLEAETGDGGLVVDLPVTVSGSWHSRHEIHGTLNGGGPTLRLHSGDGSIHIERL